MKPPLSITAALAAMPVYREPPREHERGRGKAAKKRDRKLRERSRRRNRG